MLPSDLSAAPTSTLVERLKTCGHDVPKGLPEEIARRGREAIEPLVALARDDALWNATDLPSSMAPIHTIHLLGAIGDVACAPVLVEAVKTRDLGDFLTEGAPAILAALDPGAIPLLAEAALDTTLDPFQRIAFAEGLYGIAARHAEHRAEVAPLFVRLLRDDDADLVSLLIDEAARIDDPGVQAAVDRAFDDGRVLGLVIRRSDVDGLRAEPRWSLSRDFKDPMAFFRNGTLDVMKRNAQAAEQRRAAPSLERAPKAPKIGRNDPCPCGSGKKYKKCCLR